MDKKYSYTPNVGWSYSRMREFDRCKRMYFFERHQKYVEELDKVELKRLKNGKTLHLLVGEIVHNQIATIIKRIQQEFDPIDLDESIENAKRNFQEFRNNSLIIEEYNDEKLPDDEPDKSLNKIEDCIRKFYSSKWFDKIINTAENLRNSWIIEPGDFGEFRIEGIKAYGKVDFLFPNFEDDKTYIIDWKTGQTNEEDNFNQMSAYFGYVNDHLQMPIEDCIAIIENLSEQSPAPFKLTGKESIIVDLKEKIENDIKLLDPYYEDIQNSIPFKINKFEKTVDIDKCHYCKYKKPCEELNNLHSVNP